MPTYQNESSKIKSKQNTLSPLLLQQERVFVYVSELGSFIEQY